SSATAGTKKDAYNADGSKTTWTALGTGYVSEFAKNLAILDAVDGAYCGNMMCEVSETNATCAADCPTAAQVGTTLPGCGNQVGKPTGYAAATNATAAYGTVGGLFADDRLYLDTEKTICALYLAVEFGVVTGAGNTTCGGRAPSYDVIDFTYSALALGLLGFTAPPAFVPK